MSYAWIALAAALAAAPEGKSLSLDPAKSVLGFRVVHKLHKVHGQSRSLQGKAVLSPGGDVQRLRDFIAHLRTCAPAIASSLAILFPALQAEIRCAATLALGQPPLLDRAVDRVTR